MTDRLTAFSFGLLLGAALLVPGLAGAQGRPCADHATVVARLAEGYGESRQSMGLAADNSVVEVFASDETGTWTITVTRPGGPTCLVASGIGWEQVSEAPPAPGEGA